MNGDTQQPASGQSTPDPKQDQSINQPVMPVVDDVPPTASFSEALPEVTWSASEFVAHNKSLQWYLYLGLGAGIFAALIYLITKDITSTAIIIIVAVIFGIVAARKPRTLDYRVDDHGLTIAGKEYPYAEFKSFSVMKEGAFSSITFLPLRRFMPPISIYFEPQDEDRILYVLSQVLPMEHRTYDMIDRFVGRIRF